MRLPVRIHGVLRFLLFLCLFTCSRAETVWQPVVDLTLTPPLKTAQGGLRFNSFAHPSHFGGDLAFLPAKPSRIELAEGGLMIRPGNAPEGIAASLAGPEQETARLFDPQDLLGLGGLPVSKVPVTAATVEARGKGTLKLTLTDAARKPLWTRELAVGSEFKQLSIPLDAAALGRVKFFTCTAEPAAEIELKTLGFEANRPEIPAADWLFRLSLGKLRRCLDPESGLVGDRAHTAQGRFLAVPSSGLNALATAVAAKQGLLDPKTAADEIRLAARTILGIRHAHGMLPHFVNREADGRVEPTPKSEFSSVDTAITLQSLLLAADVMAMTDVAESIRERVRSIGWDGMYEDHGYPRHGYGPDGTTILPNAYRGWGGEQALTVLLESMGRGPKARGQLNPAGKVYHGVGFIAEIQSLLHPDFDQEEPDKLSGISWMKTRRQLAVDQAVYFSKLQPECPANKLGLWGLSAGAGGMPDAGYAANGTETAGCEWIHPHYPLMATMCRPESLGEVVKAFDRAGLLFPRGLPEAVSIDGIRHNPLQSSLNAGFETLAAYHAWKRPTGTDEIDRASRSDPMIRSGMARFYPQAP